MNNELIKFSNQSSSPSNTHISTQILIGRVVDIILNDSHPEFKRMGEWDSLGAIFFNEVNKVTSGDNLKNLPFAKPLQPYKKYYPLKGEIVYIISFSNQNTQNNLSLNDYYYLDVINIWNHPHQNSLPQIYNTDQTIRNDYNKVAEGNLQIQKQNSTNLELNNNFPEKQNIKPLLPKEGDLIFESRFGSSIRFSNDSKGNPITIIRNGQKINTDDKGWIPNDEDVNGDLGSIYFISEGSIPIEVASKNLKSFNINETINQNIIETQKTFLNVLPSPLPDTGSNINRYVSSSIQPTNTGSFDVNDDFVVNDDSFQEGEFENLNEATFNGSTSGKTELVENKNNIQYTRTSFKLNKTDSFGKINNILVSKYAYPILDMIAYAEGTPFYGGNDGYDVVVGGSVIEKWNINYTKGHPNILIKLNPTLSSTGAGRYGFLKRTWDQYAKLLPFNKNNQDYIAYLLMISKGFRESNFKAIFDASNNDVNNNREFLSLLDKISFVWASISDSQGNFRYSGQGTSKPDKLYFIYKEAMKKYNLK